MNETWSSDTTRVGTSRGATLRPAVAADRLGWGSNVGGVSYQEDDLAGNRANPEAQHLFLVEDSDDDAMLFDLAVRNSGRNINAHRAASLAQARALLAGRRPALIALDCHLRGESGLVLLREIRSMESFRRVPVVMMSGTEWEPDVQEAYAYGANSFLRKPNSFQEYLECVGLMLEYWLAQNCVTLAPRAGAMGPLLIGLAK